MHMYISIGLEYVCTVDVDRMCGVCCRGRSAPEEKGGEREASFSSQAG